MSQIRSVSLTRHSDALTQLVHRLEPRGRLVRSRRLRGGLSARMDVIDIERSDGSRRKVVLRRYVGDHRASPEDAAREFRTLGLLEEVGVAAPRPLLLDAQGELFAVPMIALTWVPGRAIFPQADLGPWTRGLAEAVAAVHRINSGEFDLSWLEQRTRGWMRARIEGWRDEAGFDPLAPEMQAVLAARLDEVEISESTLVHSDYWSGNAVWYRGRVAAIVDWTQAVAGDPRADVAECRVDFALSHGMEVGDLFREDYERTTGARLHDLWFFDLYRGFNALREYPEWLEGYHDLGQTHVTAKDAGERLRAFLRRALNEAGYWRRLTGPGVS